MNKTANKIWMTEKLSMANLKKSMMEMKISWKIWNYSRNAGWVWKRTQGFESWNEGKAINENKTIGYLNDSVLKSS